MPIFVPAWIIGIFVVTGGIFWCLVFAWLVGFLAEQMGITGR